MIKPLIAPALLCFHRSISSSTGFGVRVAAGFGIRAMSAPPSYNPAMGPSEVREAKLLDAINDNYGGVVLEVKTPTESATFSFLLKASIEQWRIQGKRGVWIKLPIEHANLIEVAVKEGFWYHHAEPSYLMLVYWIPEGPHTLPPNASHRVGVGAFVMNSKREVLVVQENSGILRGTGLWKFPTGVVNEGEDIFEAAVREVKEETAIDSKFVEVLAFRQSHKAFFDKSDLFFICHLEPLSFDIQKQESEIEAAEWMPFEEYASQPFVKTHELLKYMVEICKSKMDKEYTGFSPVPTTSSFSKEKSFLYLDKRSLL